MSEQATTAVSASANGLDSVQRLARELAGGGNDPLALKGVLGWGWHAVSVLAHTRLGPARDSFDHWFWDYLEGTEPQLDSWRDALWQARSLSHIELLDILSEENLAILKPTFYQGWQDRTARCHTLRERATAAIGGSIGAAQREDLMLLLAAHNRLLRVQAAVEMNSAPLVKALPALFDLLELLGSQPESESEPMMAAIATCRQELQALV